MRAVIAALLFASLSLSGCLDFHTFERCNERKEEPLFGDTTMQMCVDGRLRTAILTVPEGDGPFPLLIALHGGAGTASNMQDKTGLDDVATNRSVMVVYPDGTPAVKFVDQIRTWNAAHCCGQARDDNTDDVTFLDALIAALQDEYAIDPSRIGITGHSNGGMMAHHYGATSDVATHIMPVAGSIGGRNPVDAAEQRIPVPDHAPPKVLIIHATDDERVPYDGGEGENLGEQRVDLGVDAAIEFWETAGASVELVTTEGGHGWPGGKADLAGFAKTPDEPNASELVVEFLLS